MTRRGLADRLTAAALLKAVALFGWAALFIGFDLAGRLPLFLAPGFRLLVLPTGVVLAVLAAALLLADARRAACQSGASCGCQGEKPQTGQIATTGFLLVFLAGAALAAPRGFSAQTVLNRMSEADFSRGIGPGRAAARPAAAEMAASRQNFAGEEEEVSAPGEERKPVLARDEGGKIEADLMDIWAAAADPSFRRFLAGRTLIVTAQLLKPPTGSEPPPGAPRFKLVRLLVTCCAADARPVTVPVFAGETPSEADMAWVRVEGRLELRMEGDEMTPYLRAESVAPAAEPAEVFLFDQ